MQKQKFKSWIWLFLLIGMIFTPIKASASEAAEADEPKIYTVTAPTKDMQMSFWLEDGVPYYSVESLDKVLIEDAKLGLSSTLADLQEEFTVKSVETSSSDTT